MAFPFARQTLTGLLILATGSAESGLLVLNRFLLLRKNLPPLSGSLLT